MVPIFLGLHSITRFPFPTAVQRTDFWQAEMGDWGVRGVAPTQKRCHFHTKVWAPSECWPEFPECGSPGHKKSALGHIASAQLLWFGWAGLLSPLWLVWGLRWLKPRWAAGSCPQCAELAVDRWGEQKGSTSPGSCSLLEWGRAG